VVLGNILSDLIGENMNDQAHGFNFHTMNGNLYYYNDIDGVVYLQKDRDKVTESINYRPKMDTFSQENIKLGNEIERFLRSGAYHQLTLIVTEQCNLRCLYCAYSGNYINNRTHQNKNMSWDVAEKAIRRYWEGYKLVEEINPSFPPAIGFYGGEPLLNFSLIVRAVNFAKTLFQDKIHFNFTTNGTILTQEMLNFLLENDFYILFSLNGDRNEHDRLRVFRDGKGSFDVLYRNLLMLRDYDSDFYFHNCGLSLTYDIGTDLQRLYDYCENNNDILPPVSIIASVNPLFTDWYSRYSPEQIKYFEKSLTLLKNKYLTSCTKGEQPFGFLNRFFQGQYLPIFRRTENTVSTNKVFPLTASCVPGRKIAVYPNGSIHCCERISENFPIGNVEIGLDVDLIENIVKQYKSKIYPGCDSCPVKRLCQICFAVVAGKNSFERNPSNLCEIFFQNTKNRFIELWTMLENGAPESIFLPKQTNVDEEWYTW